MSYIYHKCVILHWVRHIYHQCVIFTTINVYSNLPSVRHNHYQCLFIFITSASYSLFINSYHQCVILTPWAQFYVHSGDEEGDGIQTPRLDLVVTLHGIVVVVQVDYPSFPRLARVKLLTTQGVLWKTSDNLYHISRMSWCQNILYYIYIWFTELILYLLIKDWDITYNTIQIYHQLSFLFIVPFICFSLKVVFLKSKWKRIFSCKHGIMWTEVNL